jgi:hypothetical protein
MKIAISVWYEYTHNGVDSGRCSRARWVGGCWRQLQLAGLMRRRWAAGAGDPACK